MACNKTDVLTLDELKEKSEEKRNLIKEIEDENIPVIPMSTLSKDGVMNVKNEVGFC